MKLKGAIYIHYKLDNDYEDALEIDASNTRNIKELELIDILEDLVK